MEYSNQQLIETDGHAGSQSRLLRKQREEEEIRKVAEACFSGRLERAIDAQYDGKKEAEICRIFGYEPRTFRFWKERIREKTKQIRKNYPTDPKTWNMLRIQKMVSFFVDNEWWEKVGIRPPRKVGNKLAADLAAVALVKMRYEDYTQEDIEQCLNHKSEWHIVVRELEKEERVPKYRDDDGRPQQLPKAWEGYEGREHLMRELYHGQPYEEVEREVEEVFRRLRGGDEWASVFLKKYRSDRISKRLIQRGSQIIEIARKEAEEVLKEQLQKPRKDNMVTGDRWSEKEETRAGEIPSRILPPSVKPVRIFYG